MNFSAWQGSFDLSDPSAIWYGIDLAFLYPFAREARRLLPEQLVTAYGLDVLIYKVRELDVPGDLERHDITIKFWRVPLYDTYGQAPVDFPQVFTSVNRRRKHTFENGALCLWYPNDGVGRRWTHGRGLLVLIELIRRQLLLELHWLKTGRWGMEDAPHGFPGSPEPRATKSHRRKA